MIVIGIIVIIIIIAFLFIFGACIISSNISKDDEYIPKHMNLKELDDEFNFEELYDEDFRKKD